ncbi:helix-turn-helix domain-containing protein [Streptomyces tagetis]|uniref:Helix-turn-helix domain-containing protein n=1 Tax=Streptomyces tagetis TaxID=2820809 RepID=A0A940XKD5_9ACTN|nr:helix-turn-helix domain-containing protein [Streptomyces sp. RG38]MBQ0828722.1 helix-turn-helix domain-containing protein [Streptomyces sp. RG38]
MDTQNPSAPPRSRSADDGNPTRSRHHRGVIHENTRHTTRFVVIGNHLVQHPALSLLAIGLGCHIQSLPTGAGADIKSLTARFPEGPTRIAAALRELEAHGYLRRERVRTSTGRIITRTISCNQPGPRRAPADAARADRPPRPSAAPRQPRPSTPPGPSRPPRPTTRHPNPPPPPHPRPTATTTGPHPAPAPPKPLPAVPLPAVPHPAVPAPALLQQAADLLTGLRRHDPRLLLSATDTAHLAPGVAAWLERDVTPGAVRHALASALPDEPLRRPAALLAHRLTAQLPPPPPFRAPATPPPPRHTLRNCDRCDRAFRAPDSVPHCLECRTNGSPRL